MKAKKQRGSTEITFHWEHQFKKDNYNVYLRIYFPLSKKSVYLSSGVYVEPEHWQRESGFVSYLCPNFARDQKALDQFKNEKQYIIKKMMFENIPLTKENFLKELNSGKTSKGVAQKNIYATFLTILDDKPIGDTTKKAYMTTLNNVREFRRALSFDDVNYKLALDWDKFLKGKYDNMNTRAGHHKVFYTLLSDAQKFGYLNFDNLQDYNKFSRPHIKGTRSALLEYVTIIENLEYKPFSTMDNMRNLFLFGCYTGLRISDVLGLRKEHIKKDAVRGIVINKEIYKLRHLGREITLPIEKLFNGKPYKMIQYYEELFEDTDYVIPTFAPQSINKYLKKLAYDAGITDIQLSFHYSRHTFLTAIALKTKSLFSVMEYGGISSVTTAQNYIHIAQQMLDKELMDIDWEM